MLLGDGPNQNVIPKLEIGWDSSVLRISYDAGIL